MPLSGMAQSVGYLIAAAGLALNGGLHGATGNWSLPVALLIALLLPQTLVGLRAAAPGYVDAAREIAAAPTKTEINETQEV
jgi:MFS transporter, CP family, cyanate transporter